MKKILTIIILLFLCANIKAQNELLAGELIIKFENRPISWNITVKIEAIGTVWNQYHNITTEYLGGTKSYSSQTSPPSNFWHASDLDWHNQGWEPVLSLGLYEVSIWEGSHKRAWFFIDYRTSHLPYAASGFIGPIDVVLEYDITNKELIFTTPNIGTVTNGSYHPIWELKNFVQLQTYGLENYWNNCLAVFNNGDDHPKFAWGPKPDFTNSYYKIYKKKGTPDFVLYDSTTSNTYLDVNQYILTGLPNANEGSAYYKITSVGYLTEVYSESGFSNTVDIRVKLPAFEKQGSEIISGINNYSLSQNYPNPFNPATTIMFSLPVSAQVTLKVYDVLGREAASLIDSYKEAGSHSIKFDASNLTSGIYFYQLKAGEYIETKKLILQK
ncbi:MAG: hypothetical protein B6D44_05925 [Ignavibacteriales bacterium UTCHB2]|nr:MAG: hypothetical protein B6D44_05925 [Ignavibacteriales bacterium UTCHB2]